MGDSPYNFQQLSREDFRLDTYNDISLGGVKIPLAKAGFYYTRNAQKVKCFSCFCELDASQINPTTDVLSLHKSKEPNCRFIKGLDAKKKFLSYDSLRYEKERRETFIEWPIPWLSADDLAADGFYYLRTDDHCACVFCGGIIGAWEFGDMPRGEHQRHFPNCPFVQGQPVGNVPITQSSILDRLPFDGEECPLPPPRWEYTVEEIRRPMAPEYKGPKRKDYVTKDSEYTVDETRRPMVPEYKGPKWKNCIMKDSREKSLSRWPERVVQKQSEMAEAGFFCCEGPKRKDYVTKESREKSFSRWPERVVQNPNEMAEAGFFYCGLSDHVRCFYCGNGLRNWEIDDKPWEQHARWYPDCNFLLMSKGQEFIDKVRQENPPYLSTTAFKERKPQKVLASSGQFKPLNDRDLELLMQLDIMQAMRGFNLPIEAIRKALRRKLEQTGLPFFSLEPCIEAVLQIMEEETRQAIQQSSDTDVEDESRERQNDNIQALSVESQTNSAVAASTSTTNAAAVALSTSSTQSISPSTSSASASSSVSPASTGDIVAAASPINTNTSQEGPAQSTTQPEAMEADEQPETEVLALSPPGATETQASNMSQREEEMLNPDHSGPPSIDINLESVSATATPVSQDETDYPVSTLRLAELERLRESITCKICTDAEFNVVFLPCKHFSTCVNCAAAMAQCPFCRADIKYVLKVKFP